MSVNVLEGATVHPSIVLSLSVLRAAGGHSLSYQLINFFTGFGGQRNNCFSALFCIADLLVWNKAFEELFNQGYPHELRHFIECVRENKTPLVTGEDGRAVLEMIYAAYASAGLGKKIELPFHAKVEKPIDLWLQQEKL